MPSNQPGLRLSQFTSLKNNNSNLSSLINNKNMQPQPQQGSNKRFISLKHQFESGSGLSGSETDISTSNENLSLEQRYVLRHTPRAEPQGQENLKENKVQLNENSNNRQLSEKRFCSNASTDQTRLTSNIRSLSEARNPMFLQKSTGNTPNRNSLKEPPSNRSSMDVSTCSYNTLIIHNDDGVYSVSNQDYNSPPAVLKNERPKSYGEQGMQEITEIPDDYLSQSQVLKHLAKEMKIPQHIRTSTARDSGVSENTDSKENQKFDWIMEETYLPNKFKSKSQPDLTKLCAPETETLQSLAKENAYLKKQLLMFCMKVAKTQKLEDEVTNIYRVYEELVQSCERREKLEHVARMRLQENLHKVQTLNRALKDQVDVFQTQLLAPSEHQILIPQLFTQNKELLAAKERQDIELAAQQATLQEQRTHIGILDTALNNAQNNIRRLEEELRKKQLYIERISQMHGINQIKKNDRKLRMDFDVELSKDPNRSSSSTNSESKWQIQEKNCQILRLENEQRHLDEQSSLRQAVSKLSLEKASQEADSRYLEEVHCAQRKVGELQVHLKGLEGRLAEKDVLIRALQNQKNCGTFDSQNLSTDSFALDSLRLTTPSFNVSNSSFTTNASLLDQAYISNSTPSCLPKNTINNGLSSSYCQKVPCNQSVVHLKSIPIPRNYSPSGSIYSSNYDDNSSYNAQNQLNFSASYDEHIKKQIDEQISKVSQLSLLQHNVHASSKVLDHVIELNPQNNKILNQLQNNRKCYRNMSNNTETFY